MGGGMDREIRYPTVDRFASLMKQKLTENSHKGDRSSWKSELACELLVRLEEEVKELKELIELEQNLPESMKTSVVLDELSKQAAREAADVGNFAMMIADKMGGLGE